MNTDRTPAKTFAQARASFAEMLGISEPTILLAVSGGSDSMGLLLLASDLCPSSALRVGFVDHGIRADVASEWRSVKDACDHLGIPVDYLRITDAPCGGNLQEWARQKRYALLTDLAHKHGIPWVAFGHTLDDQAETIMLRIMRGTGIDGLAGMPGQRILDGDVRLCRPLLNVTRVDVQSWLRDRKISWATDPSNLNDRFSRVRVRESLLPLMEKIAPEVKSRLVALAREASQTAAFLHELQESKNQIESIILNKGRKVKKEVFEGLNDAMKARVVRHALFQLNGHLRRVDRSHLQRVVEALGCISGRTRTFEFPGVSVAKIAYGDLYLWSSDLPDVQYDLIPVVSGMAENPVMGVSVQVGTGAFEGLCLRTRLPGDRISGSDEKFSRRLVDARIPVFYRNAFPVLAWGSQVFSSPGLLTGEHCGLSVTWELAADCALNDLLL